MKIWFHYFVQCYLEKRIDKFIDLLCQFCTVPVCSVEMKTVLLPPRWRCTWSFQKLWGRTKDGHGVRESIVYINCQYLFLKCPFCGSYKLIFKRIILWEFYCTLPVHFAISIIFWLWIFYSKSPNSEKVSRWNPFSKNRCVIIDSKKDFGWTLIGKSKLFCIVEILKTKLIFKM